MVGGFGQAYPLNPVPLSGNGVVDQKKRDYICLVWDLMLDETYSP